MSTLLCKLYFLLSTCVPFLSKSVIITTLGAKEGGKRDTLSNCPAANALISRVLERLGKFYSHIHKDTIVRQPFSPPSPAPCLLWEDGEEVDRMASQIPGV